MWVAVGLFAGEEDALDERLSLPRNRRLDSADFHDVHADAFEKRSHGCISAIISRTAVSRPVNTARQTILWPMFSSTRCGTVRMSAMFM